MNIHLILSVSYMKYEPIKFKLQIYCVCCIEPDSVYVTELSGLLTRLSAELFILTEYCLQDGRTGMENALRRSLVSNKQYGVG